MKIVVKIYLYYCNTDRPSPPEYVSVNMIESELEAANVTKINISWTATNVLRVIQSYTILFKSHTAETTQLYYITELNTFASKCGIFFAYVTAVNGAGESDPSNNVTIPSLPDIGPVTTSLAHQVWKSGGETVVSVSFQVRHDYGLIVHII